MSAVVSRLVEVVVFRFRADRAEYLLLKRADNESLYPGIWQIVTGTGRDGEKAIDAARRELREETGFTPVRFWVVPLTNSFYDPSRDETNLITVFAAQAGGSDELHLSAEHGSAVWLPLHEALPLVVWPGQREALSVVDRYILGGEEAGRLTLVDG